MSKKDLIPGGYKFTDEDRQKARESKRVNSSFRKMAKKIRGFPVTDPDDIKFLEAHDIPVQEQTLGTLIVLRAAVGASLGNKDDRRDYMRMTGDDPDVMAKEAEIDIKKQQLEQKNGTDTERQEPAIRARAELRAKVDAAMRQAHGNQ